MPTTPRGYRYPSSTSAVNVPADIQNLATDVDTEVTALLPATVSSNDGAATDGTTTSTFPTFTNTLTTGIRGVAFTAAKTGRAEVHFMIGQVRSSAAGGSNVIGVEVRQLGVVGSGTVVYAANSVPSETVVAVSTAGGENKIAVGFALISGLTAGAVYNACIVYAGTGGTMTCNRRNIMVRPAS